MGIFVSFLFLFVISLIQCVDSLNAGGDDRVSSADDSSDDEDDVMSGRRRETIEAEQLAINDVRIILRLRDEGRMERKRGSLDSFSCPIFCFVSKEIALHPNNTFYMLYFLIQSFIVHYLKVSESKTSLFFLPRQ